MYSVLLDMVSRSIQAEPSVCLRPGAILHGTVEGTPGRLIAATGSLRVPLPESAPFQPRQAVLIEVKETPQGLQLQVREAPRAPEAAPGAPVASSPAAPSVPAAAKPEVVALMRMVEGALEAVGVPGRTDAAVEILPPSLPHSDAALRDFFAAFANKVSLGSDLRALGDLAARAVAAGALSRREAGLLTNAVARSVAKGLSEFEAVLKQLARDAAPVEARLAAALASSEPGTAENALKQDLRGLLGKLRQDEAFQGFLRDTGQTRSFDQLADRVLARLSEGCAQNVRRVDQPYLFLDVPFAPGAPIQRAQIHVFSGGKGRGRQFDAHNATVALDLSTARLGDLWVTVTFDGTRCACRICARSEKAVEALRGASDELEASLRASGYRHATVQAVMWDGDRLRAAATLMRQFSGARAPLNVEA